MDAASATEKAESARPRTPRRGRPPQSAEDIAARKSQIVEAAYDVFRDKGYHASGIADIASRLGVGHGTVYRYFENKREILDHVIDHAVAKVVGSPVVEDFAAVDSVAEFRAQLTKVGESLYYQVVDSDPGLLRMIMLDAAAIDEELLQRVLGLTETAIATIATELSEGVRRGFLRATLDCESAARALLGCVAAGVLAEARGVGTTQAARRRYIDTVVSLICDNVEPGAAR